MGQCYTDMVLGAKLSVFVAAETGDLAKLKKMIDRGRIAVDDVKDDERWTALHYSAPRGNLEVAQYLVGKGADVNARAADGLTAVMYPAGNGHLEYVQFLLEGGADVCAVKDDGSERTTALCMAVSNNDPAMVRLLLKHGADPAEGVLGWGKKSIAEYVKANPDKIELREALLL